MIQVTFNTDGTVGIYASQDDVRFSVTAPANRLQSVLPPTTFDSLRDHMAGLLEITAQAPRLRTVGGK